MTMVSTLSVENLSLKRERECPRPSDMVLMSRWSTPPSSAESCCRIPRYRSWVVESERTGMERALLIVDAVEMSDDRPLISTEELLLRTQLGLRNHQHLLELLLLLLLLSLGRIAAPTRHIHQELGQRVGQSPLLDRREVLNGRGRGRESLDRLDLQPIRGSAVLPSNHLAPVQACPKISESLTPCWRPRASQTPSTSPCCQSWHRC